MARSKKFLKGYLLLDGGGLAGSYFHRTVVLVCEHNKEGAFGLVLNRPSTNTLADILTKPLPERIRAEILHGGGPVQPAALSYLHHEPTLIEGNVMAQLSVGHDLDGLLELGNAWSPARRLRVFAGYAGWAPGQLDDEMKRGAWLTEKASVDLVFHQPSEELWRRILRARADWRERLLSEAPDDLASN